MFRTVFDRTTGIARVGSRQAERLVRAVLNEAAGRVRPGGARTGPAAGSSATAPPPSAPPPPAARPKRQTTSPQRSKPAGARAAAKRKPAAKRPAKPKPAAAPEPAAAAEKPPTGFPEPPGKDPGDISGDREAHHALNSPATNPDVTEWPDPYEAREDPRDPPDPDGQPFGEEPHPQTGSVSTSDPKAHDDLEAIPAEGPKRDKVDE